MKIDLKIHAAFSLKEKRKVVNSIKHKLSARFKVAVAEVDDQEFHNSAIIGVSFISMKKPHAVTRGQNIVTFLEENASDVFNDYSFIVEEY